MGRWWRRGAVLAVGGCMAVAAAGCGQLFAGKPAQQPVTLKQLANRVDSLDAQVGELQAAIASMGQGGAVSANKQDGVVRQNLPVAVVEASVLNVRNAPSLTGTVVGQLLQNARLNVLKQDGNWSEVTFTNGFTHGTLQGWVDSDYLGPIIPAVPSTPSTSSSSAGSAGGAGAVGHAAASASQAASGGGTAVTAASGSLGAKAASGRGTPAGSASSGALPAYG